MRVASGDHRGVSEMDFRNVTLMRICAVVIHHPDFFVARSCVDVGDLRLRDAGKAAAQQRDDVVRELMRESSRIGIGGRAAINLLQRGRRGGIVDVGEKSRGGQTGAVHG